MPMLFEDNYKEERINGVIYNMAPSAGFRHGHINGNLYYVLRRQLRNSLCAVFMENLDLYMDDDYVTPDVMLICDRNRVKNDKYRGVPRFVAETLSPSTAMRDKTIKKDKYEEIGIDEYWIISPKERSVDIYWLESGRYVLRGSYILEDDNTSDDYNADTVLSLKALPEIKITLKDIFENIS
jgi:Uma2 family endonuclease